MFERHRGPASTKLTPRASRSTSWEARHCPPDRCPGRMTPERHRRGYARREVREGRLPAGDSAGCRAPAPGKGAPRAPDATTLDAGCAAHPHHQRCRDHHLADHRGLIGRRGECLTRPPLRGHRVHGRDLARADRHHAMDLHATPHAPRPVLPRTGPRAERAHRDGVHPHILMDTTPPEDARVLVNNGPPGALGRGHPDTLRRGQGLARVRDEGGP
ncbi:hypothetical protein WA016_03737 [Myxococcus stipitatus]